MTASAKPAVALPKKAILEKLTVDELRAGIERCGISVRDHRKKGLVRSLAARGGYAAIQEILSGLPRDRLKELCRACDLDDRGRTKTDLAVRLVGQPVLSVRQPSAWAIISGVQDIENRGWSPKFSGRLYLHASKAKPPDKHVDEMCSLAAEEGRRAGTDPGAVRTRTSVRKGHRVGEGRRCRDRIRQPMADQ